MCGRLFCRFKVTYKSAGKAGIDITENMSYNNVAKANPFRYRGYYYDEGIGLYYLKSRYYDPETGRFITIDDISYLDPETINGLNLYAYCGNNPVMRTDSQGANWWTDFWNGVGNWFKKNWTKLISGLEICVGIALLFVPGAQVFAPMLLGAGITSLIGGYTNQYAGGSFFAGWAGGQISGIISGIPIPGAQIVFGFLGGFIGNLTTGLIDKLGYGKNISWESMILSSILSGWINALFNYAVPDIVFGVKIDSDWYNLAVYGYLLYTGFVWSIRSLIISLVGGKFPNI